MQGVADNLTFAPPPEPAAVRGFVLAVIAHLLLLIALTWGISWQRDNENIAVEAELWSSIPTEAAPPPAPPQPEVQPPPAVQPPPPAVTKEPDIALEREKKRRAEEAQRQEDERRQLEAQKKKEQQKLADEKKLREEQAKKLEALRRDNLQRMLAEAAGNGAPNARGTAAKSAGPSDSYAGRIRARVKPNIVYMDDSPGNPSAEVEVRVAPDGTIVSRTITKASGVKSWDEAVLRALDKTEVLPRDVDGRVHTPLIIVFSPRS